jgi:hypothetical protein
VAFRHIASALLRRGIPLRIFDFPEPYKRQGEDDSLKEHFVPTLGALPFQVNIVLLNLTALPSFLLGLDKEDVAWDARLNVAVVFWELPEIPPHWIPAIGAFDVALCGSWFIREAISRQVPGTLPLHLEYPLMLPEIPKAVRSEFAVPSDAYTFYSSLDPYAGVERKNPFATLAAFRQAFAGDDRVHLVMKLNAAPDSLHNLSYEARRFVDQCSSTNNVTAIARTGSYADALALCNACCDCFVSLHRAEGLGLGPLEAMLMGKPTILTGWSGSMSYATADSSCLVPYVLVRPTGLESPQFDASFLGARTRWADPSVASAAYWMRRLADDPEFAASIAARGRERASRYVAEAAECRFVAELRQLHALKSSHGFPVPGLDESQRRILRAERAHMGLYVQRAKRILANNVPGYWRLLRWQSRSR